jgi:hypothetical protein
MARKLTITNEQATLALAGRAAYFADATGALASSPIIHGGQIYEATAAATTREQTTIPITSSLGDQLYFSEYFSFPAAPAGAEVYVVSLQSATGYILLSLQTNRTIRLLSNINGNHATTSTVFAVDTKYRYSIGVKVDSGAADTLEVRFYLGESETPIETLGPLTGLSITDAPIDSFQDGATSAGHTSPFTFRTDHLIVNDGSGSGPDSTWPRAVGAETRALPVFRAAGTPAIAPNTVVNPTSLTPGNPTRQAGDAEILVTFCRSITATCATPSGWSLLPGFPVRSATASGGTWYAFGLVTDGTEAAPTVTWTGVTTGTSGDTSQAVILAYSGVDTSGGGAALFDVPRTVSDSGSQTTTVAVPAITTLLDNSMIVGLIAKVTDGGTFTPPSGWTERVDSGTSNGSGHHLEVAELAKATAGLTSATTAAPSGTSSGRSLSVNIVLRGTVIRVLSAGAADSASVSDASAGAKTTNRAAADTASLSELAAARKTVERGVGDSGSVAEAAAGSKATARAAADSTSVSDGATGALAGAPPPAGASPWRTRWGLTVGGVLGRTGELSPLVFRKRAADSAGVSDGAGAILHRKARASDTAGASDSARMGRERAVFATDSVVSQGSANYGDFDYGDGDYGGATVEMDFARAQLGWLRGAADSVSTSDAVSHRVNVKRAAADSAVVSEAAAGLMLRRGTAADVTSVSMVATAAREALGAAVDVLVTLDSARVGARAKLGALTEDFAGGISTAPDRWGGLATATAVGGRAAFAAGQQLTSTPDFYDPIGSGFLAQIDVSGLSAGGMYGRILLLPGSLKNWVTAYVHRDTGQVEFAEAINDVIVGGSTFAAFDRSQPLWVRVWHHQGLGVWTYSFRQGSNPWTVARVAAEQQPVTTSARLNFRADSGTVGTAFLDNVNVPVAAATAATAADSAPAVATVTAPWQKTRTVADSAPATDAAQRIGLSVSFAADAAGGSDAASARRALQGVVADDASVSSDVVAFRTFFRSAADAAGVAQQVAASLAVSRAAADSVPVVSDAATTGRALNAFAPEQAPVLDDVFVQAGGLRSALDVTEVTDQTQESRSASRAAGDFLSTSDVVRGLMARSGAAADSAGVSDAAARRVAVARSVLVALSLSDAAAALRGRVGLAGDVVSGVADAVGRLVAVTRSALDAAGVAELASATRARSRAITDSAPAADGVSRRVGVSRAAADSTSLSEAVSSLIGGRALAADAAPAVDAARRMVSVLVRASDVQATTETVAGTVGRGGVAADSAPASDMALRAQAVVFRGAMDATSLGDAGVGRVAGARGVSEVLVTADAAGRVSAVTRVAGDAVGGGLDEAHAALLRALGGSALDVAGAADVVAGRVAAVRAAADSGSASDVAVALKLLSAMVTDSAGASDVASLRRDVTVEVADAAPAVDVARSGLLVSRAALDALVTSDVARARLLLDAHLAVFDTVGGQDVARARLSMPMPVVRGSLAAVLLPKAVV